MRPGDSLLEVAGSDAVIGDKLRLEGMGIAPDVQVAFPLAYAAGKDLQREAAITEMLRMLQATPRPKPCRLKNRPQLGDACAGPPDVCRR